MSLEGYGYLPTLVHTLARNDLDRPSGSSEASRQGLRRRGVVGIKGGKTNVMHGSLPANPEGGAY
jgi:hypothetical protein